jgi:hypothetical protein
LEVREDNKKSDITYLGAQVQGMALSKCFLVETAAAAQSCLACLVRLTRRVGNSRREGLHDGRRF